MPTEAELMARIHSVPDPCSYGSGVPLSIGEMGLLQKVENDAGRVTVRMQLTSPMCMMAAYFMREIEQRLLAEEGVTSVQVEFDRAFEWKPEDICADGRQRLFERRVSMIGGRMLPRDKAPATGS